MSVTLDTPPPAGVFPFFMTNSAAEKNGLKSGLGIIDLVPLKSFRTADALAEISKYGFMSAFAACETKLKECELDEFMIACDPKSTYGEMFLLLYTSESIDSYTSGKESKESAEDEEERLAREAAAAEEAERQARLNAVYVETPFVPREYKSETLLDTVKEVEALTVKPKRPLLTFRFSRTVSASRQPIELQDGPTQTVSFIPTTVDGRAMNKKLQQDKCLTTIPAFTSTAVQTAKNRSTNKICQYETLTLDPSKVDMDKVQSKILRLFHRVMPTVETALQQNESIGDIFSDEFLVPDECLHETGPSDSNLTEARNFADLEFSKGKTISCIEWHPHRDDIVAASLCKSPTADDKIAALWKPVSSYIVLWKFTEWIQPYIVLASPHECRSFRFNPTCPAIVVAGCSNGQVVMWDVASTMKMLESNEGPSDMANDRRSPLQPSALSQLEVSHKQGVSDMFWLPPYMQIDAKGQPLSKEHMSDETFQFVTVCGSEILFWDTRYKDILAGKLPHIVKTRKAVKHENRDISEILHMDWIPIFRSKIRRMEGRAQIMSINQAAYVFRSREVEQGADYHLNTSIYCATEEGDLALINWNPSIQEEAKNEDEPPDIVQWYCLDHFGKVLSLEQSPFFSHILVSVSSWSFHIWNVQSHASRPLFISPHPASNFTLGRWSPTRPGLLLLAKVDGTIDMWNFTDSFSASTTQAVATSCITSMEFLHDMNKSRPPMLAVGDATGSLHVFDLPRTMWRAQPNERSKVESFFNHGNLSSANQAAD